MDKDISFSSNGQFVGYASSNELICESDSYCALSMSALLASGDIPPSHKRIADNYMIIKKLYGLNSIQARITNTDRNKLLKYDFVPLECSTMKQINEEIAYLKKWSLSIDEKLRKEADEETEYVKNFCREHGIECFIKKEKVEQLAKMQKIGTEEAGRKLRYDFFDEVLENATKDENFTADALRKHFILIPNKEAKEVLNFTSDNKYSAATFDDYTYALGAFEVLPIMNAEEIKGQVDSYSAKGNRVLVLVRGREGIKDKKIAGRVEAVSLVILEDHIRENAKDTFAWFNENKVDVKVISGDNALAVSEIAKNAGVKNAEKFVSLAGKSLEETYELAKEYTVFGRVTPEQKETLIKAFKDMGKTVAMTGDGVNDILALKRADCSIAMASGADAARNVSHIVLMDNNFDHLPEVVGEGRRVVNNLQRSSSIFLVKTFFAMVLTFLFTLLSIIRNSNIAYPFSTMNMYPWEILTIGYASFFLALQPNKEIIKGKFLGNIFKKSLPAAAMMIASVLIVFGFHTADVLGIAYFGLDDFRIATYLSALVFNTLSLVVLYKISSPLDKYRRRVFIGICCGFVLLLGYEGFISFKGLHNSWTIIDINYDLIGKVGFAIGVATILICATFYLGGTGIYELVKKRGLESNDRSK